MRGECPSTRSAAGDLARECLYRYLSTVVRGPYSDGWDRARDAGDRALALEAADWLRAGSAPEAVPPAPGAGEAEAVDRDLTRLVEELQAPTEALRAEYDRVFGLVVPEECPPYETEYYPTRDVFARSQQMADVAGFYRAFGIEPAQAAPERPDHLALELEFMAFLLTKERLALAAVALDPGAGERASICDQAQRDFFRDHLAWWVPSFAAGLRRKAGGGYHGALAGALAAWVASECRRLDIPGVLRPARPGLIERPEEQSGCAACPLLP